MKSVSRIASAALLLMVTLVSGGCGGSGGGGGGAALQSIMVQTPNSGSIGVNATAQVVAIGTYSDGSTLDITRRADWSSSAPTVVTVTQGSGLATGKSVGSSTITATLDSVTGTAELSVAAGIWMHSGNMSTPRLEHTATLLPDGKVLVVGGFSGPSKTNGQYSAELYDPATGAWTATGMQVIYRADHTATLLQSGKVLVAGGTSGNESDAECELYDPASGTWTATGNLSVARAFHTATLLPDGRVLVAGGGTQVPSGQSTALASAELYDPATGAWSPTGTMLTLRGGHTATLLSDGRVLVAGGDSPLPNSPGVSVELASAEMYDPSTGIWSATGSMTDGRVFHAATGLKDGRVLVAGGLVSPYPGNQFFSSSEIYDPTAGTWAPTGNMTIGRMSFTLTLLTDGTALAAGTYNYNSPPLPSAEVYDPAAGTWAATGSMKDGRYSHTATLLPNGPVLVTGGTTLSAPLASSEIYYP